ncbi:winged helix-turn-helix domain-containing protein [Vermiculatibacterium agrestimuris]|uniref:winged helix-turn-helix domain-containing protein n=1 Tax=Vermiculatibacterium agrestimuris TaxID=2941519 RepID=UPI00203E97F6|nr:winged helix-turn-helix domain-containing protein [Vermiculatibacterium agrestimuris]
MKNQQTTISTKENVLPTEKSISDALIQFTQEDLDVAELHQSLTEFADQVGQALSHLEEEGSLPQREALIEAVGRVAGGLRSYTRKKHSIRFYYYGMFQEKYDELKRQEEKAKQDRQLQVVAGRKYFPKIIEYLYQHGTAQQIKMAEDVGMDRSNLFREMKLLVDVGLVDQRKIRKYRYYDLTPYGYRIYRTQYSRAKRKTSHTDKDPYQISDIFYRVEKEVIDVGTICGHPLSPELKVLASSKSHKVYKEHLYQLVSARDAEKKPDEFTLVVKMEG